MNAQELRSHVSKLFSQRFSREPAFSLTAPGRVNLIGEHTDYNDGFVLPMAIERYVAMAAAPGSRAGSRVMRVYSDTMNESVEIPLEHRPIPTQPRWANYLRGVVAGFFDRGKEVPSLDVVVSSTVPLGSGLSSSAALEVATATLLETALDEPMNPVEKAKLCQRAEHEFANVPCGLMDQLASCLGKKEGALLIDCRDQSTRLVTLSQPTVSVLICNTGVRHSLADGEYGKRRADCARAAEILGVSQLRDCDEPAVLAAKYRLPSPLFERARHVVTENARTLRFADALDRNDWAAAGELMYQSHRSLRDDYEVSCRELDLVVDTAREQGIEGGVYGARMTGGGFGGSAVCLVETAQVARVVEHLSRVYREHTRLELDAFVTRPSEGSVWK
jgi:galactokinase